jgi:hypothetical protein
MAAGIATTIYERWHRSQRSDAESKLTSLSVTITGPACADLSALVSICDDDLDGVIDTVIIDGHRFNAKDCTQPFTENAACSKTMKTL